MNAQSFKDDYVKGLINDLNNTPVDNSSFDSTNIGSDVGAELGQVASLDVYPYNEGGDGQPTYMATNDGIPEVRIHGPRPGFSLSGDKHSFEARQGTKRTDPRAANPLPGDKTIAGNNEWGRLSPDEAAVWRIRHQRERAEDKEKEGNTFLHNLGQGIRNLGIGTIGF